MMITT